MWCKRPWYNFRLLRDGELKRCGRCVGAIRATPRVAENSPEGVKGGTLMICADTRLIDWTRCQKCERCPAPTLGWAREPIFGRLCYLWEMGPTPQLNSSFPKQIFFCCFIGLLLFATSIKHSIKLYVTKLLFILYIFILFLIWFDRSDTNSVQDDWRN